MCDPTVLAVTSFALNAGGIIADQMQGEKISRENREAALRAMREAWTDIGLIQGQEIENVAQAMTEADRVAAYSEAIAATGAVEGGVAGVSVEDLLREVDRQLYAFRTTSQRNLDRTLRQLDREKISGRTLAQQRIAQVPPPSFALTGLRLGTAAVGFAAGEVERQERAIEAARAGAS